MSTRRRLANRDKAEHGDILPEVYRCKFCRREFAKGTPRKTLDDHIATHGPSRLASCAGHQGRSCFDWLTTTGECPACGQRI